MHSRTAFEDFEEQSQRRKLLRLWLKMSNARELAKDFPGRNGIAAKVAQFMKNSAQDGFFTSG